MRRSVALAPEELDRLAVLESSEADEGKRPKIGEKLVGEAIKNELTPRQRELLRDYYFSRLTVYEIAELRGISPSTVSRTLGRARRNLYRALRYAGR